MRRKFNKIIFSIVGSEHRSGLIFIMIVNVCCLKFIFINPDTLFNKLFSITEFKVNLNLKFQTQR